MNSYLTDINSTQENDFIHSLAGPGRIWIGFNDRDFEGMFVWTRTGQAGAFTNWSSLEPNDHDGGEDCAVVDNTDWNDVACADTYRYICKMGE